MAGASTVEQAAFAKLQREPLVLDADPDAVLRALEKEAGQLA
jgi:hypothetical protein